MGRRTPTWKSLRKAYERGRAYALPLMVSVWDAETRVSIAAARAPGGNEVAATLALLKTLVLKGCIVTADALHCHPRMAEGVLASGGDYAAHHRLRSRRRGSLAA